MIRSKPAAAKTAPFQSLSANFFRREFTFPRKSTTLCVAYLLSHCACLRKLPVAIVPSPLRKSIFPLCTKISKVLALSRTAACTIPTGKAVGTSFIECTAISTSPLIIATSSVLVNIPVIPSSYNGLSRIISPVDLTATILVLYPKSFSFFCTVCACQSASSLSLVPILITFSAIFIFYFQKKVSFHLRN